MASDHTNERTPPGRAPSPGTAPRRGLPLARPVLAPVAAAAARLPARAPRAPQVHSVGTMEAPRRRPSLPRSVPSSRRTPDRGVRGWRKIRFDGVQGSRPWLFLRLPQPVPPRSACGCVLAGVPRGRRRLMDSAPTRRSSVPHNSSPPRSCAATSLRCRWPRHPPRTSSRSSTARRYFPRMLEDVARPRRITSTCSSTATSRATSGRPFLEALAAKVARGRRGPARGRCHRQRDRCRQQGAVPASCWRPASRWSPTTGSCVAAFGRPRRSRTSSRTRRTSSTSTIARWSWSTGAVGYVGGSGIEDHYNDERFYDVMCRVEGPDRRPARSCCSC